MMLVLLDTDVVLDYLLDRAPFAEDAAVIWESGERGEAGLFVAAITPLNLYYVARKLKGAAAARQLVSSLLKACRVCTLDQTILLAAQTTTMPDFEDAVQAVSAEFFGLDAVVTRNPTDFTNSAVQVLTASEMARLLSE